MTIVRKMVLTLLTWEARLMLFRFKPRIIAITGSVGKTSTKDAIFTALSEHTHVRKSEKSFNSEFGVPLTILGEETGWRNPMSWLFILVRGFFKIVFTQEYPSTLVLEVGADHPGDMRKIASWLRPHIAVVTGIPEIPVHVSQFASVDELVAEKQELVRHTRKDGHVILCGDFAYTKMMRELCLRPITFGFLETNDYVGTHEEIVYGADSKPTGIQFRTTKSGASVPVVLRGVLGSAHVYPVLAACAVAEVCGIDLVSAARAFERHDPAPGRMRIIEGTNGATIIDDTYNASPIALESALKTLALLAAGGRKIAVLGDMLELGEYSRDAHLRIGAHAASIVSELYTVGKEAEIFAEGAASTGLNPDRVHIFPEDGAKAAAERLRAHIQEGDVILVKGSQGRRMERTVKHLMLQPEKAHELLVRQSSEWLQR